MPHSGVKKNRMGYDVYNGTSGVMLKWCHGRSGLGVFSRPGFNTYIKAADTECSVPRGHSLPWVTSKIRRLKKMRRLGSRYE